MSHPATRGELQFLIRGGWAQAPVLAIVRQRCFQERGQGQGSSGVWEFIVGNVVFRSRAFQHPKHLEGNTLANARFFLTSLVGPGGVDNSVPFLLSALQTSLMTLTCPVLYEMHLLHTCLLSTMPQNSRFLFPELLALMARMVHASWPSSPNVLHG